MMVLHTLHYAGVLHLLVEPREPILTCNIIYGTLVLVLNSQLRGANEECDKEDILPYGFFDTFRDNLR